MSLNVSKEILTLFLDYNDAPTTDLNYNSYGEPVTTDFPNVDIPNTNYPSGPSGSGSGGTKNKGNSGSPDYTDPNNGQSQNIPFIPTDLNTGSNSNSNSNNNKNYNGGGEFPLTNFGNSGNPPRRINVNRPNNNGGANSNNPVRRPNINRNTNNPRQEPINRPRRTQQNTNQWRNWFGQESNGNNYFGLGYVPKRINQPSMNNFGQQNNQRRNNPRRNNNQRNPSRPRNNQQNSNNNYNYY